MNKIFDSLRRKSPEILAVFGITGMISTVILAVKATPKAMQLIEEKKEATKEEPTKPEIIKTAWKCYIPAAITGAVSVACLITSYAVSSKRSIALTTAYVMSETARKEYAEKVTDIFGEKKEKEVTDSIAKDKIEASPVTKQEVIITEHGNTLCFDSLSGRYFRSDIEKLRKVANELNERMLIENYVSLNEFYYEIGLDGIEVGDWLGWNVQKTGLISLKFSSQITDNGLPCIVLNHSNPPVYDYGL